MDGVQYTFQATLVHILYSKLNRLIIQRLMQQLLAAKKPNWKKGRVTAQ
jgi:hypothetical protein